MRKLVAVNVMLALAASAVIVSLLTPIAVAGEMSKDDVQARLAAMKEKLKLTPDQEEKIKPLLQAQAEKLKGIHDKYLNKTDDASKKAKMDEVRAAKRDLHDKLGGILSKEQMADWEKMRDESAQKMKEKHAGMN